MEEIETPTPPCASCWQPTTGRAYSWRFERLSGSETTIWLCKNCVPRSEELCAVCAKKQTLDRIPLCAGCLFEYERATEQPQEAPLRKPA